jgi:hypothetical protein
MQTNIKQIHILTGCRPHQTPRLILGDFRPRPSDGGLPPPLFFGGLTQTEQTQTKLGGLAPRPPTCTSSCRLDATRVSSGSSGLGAKTNTHT